MQLHGPEHLRAAWSRGIIGHHVAACSRGIIGWETGFLKLSCLLEHLNSNMCPSSLALRFGRLGCTGKEQQRRGEWQGQHRGWACPPSQPSELLSAPVGLSCSFSCCCSCICVCLCVYTCSRRCRRRRCSCCVVSSVQQRASFWTCSSGHHCGCPCMRTCASGCSRTVKQARTSSICLAPSRMHASLLGDLP